MSSASPLDRFGFLTSTSTGSSLPSSSNSIPNSATAPLAVVPTMADTTCCIAASYEAKALGIKTGTQVGEAKKRCPEIILIEGNHTEYAKYSKAISDTVETRRLFMS